MAASDFTFSNGSHMSQDMKICADEMDRQTTGNWGSSIRPTKASAQRRLQGLCTYHSTITREPSICAAFWVEAVMLTFKDETLKIHKNLE